MADTPERAIRRFCLDCQGRHPPAVAACADMDCPLHPLRQAALNGCWSNAQEGPDNPVVPPAPACLPDSSQSRVPAMALKAGAARVIRVFCLRCAGSRAEARSCDAKDACPLWSYRFGVSPLTFRRVVTRRRVWREQPLLPGLR